MLRTGPAKAKRAPGTKYCVLHRASRWLSAASTEASSLICCDGAPRCQQPVLWRLRPDSVVRRTLISSTASATFCCLARAPSPPALAWRAGPLARRHMGCLLMPKGAMYDV